jgi:transposase
VPYLSWDHDQVWLLPPSLDECVALDHPVRFIDDVVAAFGTELRGQLELDERADTRGRAAYPPDLLVRVWLYGFMRGIRSSRKLEAACREQLPLIWLCGQLQPDHNTLARYWCEHRTAMQEITRHTARVLYRAGLVDETFQAVDGTKLGANATKRKTHSLAGLRRLMARIDVAIKELEAQEATGGEPGVGAMPRELANATARRERIAALIEEIEQEGRSEINVTDPDARLMKSSSGAIIAGYNGQLMVSEVSENGYHGRVITAAEMTMAPADNAELLPMIEAAEETLGVRAGLTLADGGYHSGANLAACKERGQAVLVAEGHEARRAGPYHKDAFVYDDETDTYRCPEGQTLRFGGTKRHRGRGPYRTYRAGAVCRGCPLFGTCTTDQRGRLLEIGPHDQVLREHRALLQTDEAKAAYRLRKSLIELVFGILKDEQGARRLLLRGYDNVQAEWRLLAAGFNLRTLYQIWRRRSDEGRIALMAG